MFLLLARYVTNKISEYWGPTDRPTDRQTTDQRTTSVPGRAFLVKL